jgi:hypothetical protein
MMAKMVPMRIIVLSTRGMTMRNVFVWWTVRIKLRISRLWIALRRRREREILLSCRKRRSGGYD